MNPRIHAILALVAVTSGLLGPPASAAGELLPNAGFEAPTLEGWVKFSSTGNSDRITFETATVKTGQQALKITAQGGADSYQGVFQPLPVTAGTEYRFSVHVRTTAEGEGRGQISIEWKDPSGNELERVWGPDWTPRSASSRWAKPTMKARAPDGAERAHFVVTQFDGEEADNAGAFVIDDASVSEK